MYIHWSNINSNGLKMSNIYGIPTYVIQGGDCYFCGNYDKHIGLLLEENNNVYDITNNDLINNNKKLFVICGSCSQILDINSNKRCEK